MTKNKKAAAILAFSREEPRLLHWEKGDYDFAVPSGGKIVNKRKNRRRTLPKEAQIF
jgi:hypothetical protein